MEGERAQEQREARGVPVLPSAFGEGQAVNAVELATALVVFYADTIREAQRAQSLWHRGQAETVKRAVMMAHGFDDDQAWEFIRTLLERID